MADQHRIMSQASKFGPGRTHLRAGAERAECDPARTLHNSEPVDDDYPLTCARCIKINGGRP